MAVDVEKGQIAVQALAHQIRQPSDGQHVRRAVQGDAVL